MMDIQDHTIRRRDVDWREEGGRVVVRRRKYGACGSAVLRLFRIDPVLTVRFDDLGSEAWLLLDGRTAGEVLEALRTTRPDEPQLPQRLGRYLSLLTSNGLIDID